jgi:hypothetical protein
VIDGEAVVLGVDGISDFNALHGGKRNAEVQLCAFDVLAIDGEDIRRLPLSMRKPSWIGCCAADRTASSSTHSRSERLGRISSRLPATWASRALCQSGATSPTAPVNRRIGSRSRTGRTTRSTGSPSRRGDRVRQSDKRSRGVTTAAAVGPDTRTSATSDHLPPAIV